MLAVDENEVETRRREDARHLSRSVKLLGTPEHRLPGS
jgi:hypothetical protein